MLSYILIQYYICVIFIVFAVVLHDLRSFFKIRFELQDVLKVIVQRKFPLRISSVNVTRSAGNFYRKVWSHLQKIMEKFICCAVCVLNFRTNLSINVLINQAVIKKRLCIKIYNVKQI